MKSPGTQTREVTPNFTTEHAITAESGLTDLLKKGQVLGVSATSIEVTPDDVINTVKRLKSGRIETVRSGLAKEGLELESLPTKALLDRLLGIDGLLKLNGKTFGIDVTTGKGTVLYNKKAKATALQPVFNHLGIDHFIVLRLRQEVSDDLVLDFFGKLEDLTLGGTEQPFVQTIKYGINTQSIT